jgi:DNA-binding beta-propeller fold protein YncE
VVWANDYGALAMRRRTPRTFILSLTWLCVASAACNLENPGDAPAEGTIYFPTAVALSPQSATSAARYLYVANANFDLRFNAGSVQAYDLDTLDSIVTGAVKTSSCTEPGAECVIFPMDHAADEDADSIDVLADEVLIPSFATGVAVSPNGERLYVVTRTEASLTFIEVDEDAQGNRLLRCGPEADRRCDGNHTRGDDSVQSERRLRLPAEPVHVIAGDAASLVAPNGNTLSGNFVMVAHREGQASLFLERAEGGGATGPILVDVLEGLSLEPTGISFDPTTGLAYLSVFDRFTDLSLGKVLARIGVAVDDVAPLQSTLYSVGDLFIDGVNAERDTRAVAIGPQSQAYVVSRSPSALLWVDVADSTTLPDARRAAQRTIEVGAGPSRLILGDVGGIPVVVVSCFDARQIFVLDARTGEALSVVHNLSGPFELAVDSVRQRLYVADFRSSVIRVIDLSPLVTGEIEDPTSARLIATIGKARLLEEFQ